MEDESLVVAGSTGKCANFSASPFSIISDSRFGSVMGAIYNGLNTLWRTGVNNLQQTIQLKGLSDQKKCPDHKFHYNAHSSKWSSWLWALMNYHQASDSS